MRKLAKPKKGITDPNRKAELGAATREKKSKALGWNGLQVTWHERMTEEERNALVATYRRVMPRDRKERGEGAAVDFAIDHSFVRDATVPERKLLTEALKRGLGEVTVEGVQRELSRRSLTPRGVEGGFVAEASPKPLRSAGPAIQNNKLDPSRVAARVAGAFAGNRDPGELVVAMRTASAPFRSGSAGGPPTVCTTSPS